MQKYVSHLLFLKSISKRGGGAFVVIETQLLAYQSSHFQNVIYFIKFNMIER